MTDGDSMFFFNLKEIQIYRLVKHMCSVSCNTLVFPLMQHTAEFWLLHCKLSAVALRANELTAHAYLRCTRQQVAKKQAGGVQGAVCLQCTFCALGQAVKMPFLFLNMVELRGDTCFTCCPGPVPSGMQGSPEALLAAPLSLSLFLCWAR